MAKKQDSETKSTNRKTPAKVSVSRKASKKRANISKKSNTESGGSVKNSVTKITNKGILKVEPKAKSTKNTKAKSSKKTKAKARNKEKASSKAKVSKGKKAEAVNSSSINAPLTVEGKPILEILASAPKVAGVLATPYFHRMQRHWEITLEVDDKIRDKVIPLMDYKPGQHMVAILIPINTSTDAAQWFILNEGMDLMQATKESDWQEQEISGKRLADLFKMTTRNVQLLTAKGYMKKNTRGRYVLHESVQLYMQHLKEEAMGKGGKEMATEKLEIIRIEKRTKDLDYRKKAEELTDVASARKAGLELGLKVNNELTRWDGLYGTRLAKAKTKQDVVSILSEARTRLLEELSKGDIG